MTAERLSFMSLIHCCIAADFSLAERALNISSHTRYCSKYDVDCLGGRFVTAMVIVNQLIVVYI